MKFTGKLQPSEMTGNGRQQGSLGSSHRDKENTNEEEGVELGRDVGNQDTCSGPLAETLEQDKVCAEAVANVLRNKAEVEADAELREAQAGERRLEEAEAENLKKRWSRLEVGLLVEDADMMEERPQERAVL